MTLQDFISALKTKEIKVILNDIDDNELIKFYSEGYASVESDILARDVSKWSITSTSSITVVLKEEAPTSESTSESTSTSESDSESESESTSESTL